MKMHSTRIALITWAVASSLLVSAPIATAEVILSQKSKIYVATGSTPAQLRWNMRLKGDAKGYFAYTKWEIYRHFDTRPTPKGCRLRDVVVRVRVKITLPELNSKETSPELRHKWVRFREALKRHEDGHAKIAKETAAKIDRMLTSFSMPYSCNRVGAAAYARSGKMIREAYEVEDAYDLNTRHGKRDGVTLK